MGLQIFLYQGLAGLDVWTFGAAERHLGQVLEKEHKSLGALSIQPKIPNISIRNQLMELTISVRSDRNIWDHL